MVKRDLLQIKRFRRSGKLNENRCPNGIKKVSQLKPLASKLIFEILMDLDKRAFLRFIRSAKRRALKTNNSDSWRPIDPPWMQIKIQIGPLSSGSGHFG